MSTLESIESECSAHFGRLKCQNKKNEKRNVPDCDVEQVKEYRKIEK